MGPATTPHQERRILGLRVGEWCRNADFDAHAFNRALKKNAGFEIQSLRLEQLLSGKIAPNGEEAEGILKTMTDLDAEFEPLSPNSR